MYQMTEKPSRLAREQEYSSRQRERLARREGVSAGRKKKQTAVSGINSAMVTILSILAFLIPWAFTPFTYEYYEITKNTILILGVIILLGLWAIKAMREKKLSLIRTAFDVPILLFLASQIVSTIFSIYTQASIWGYYSRLAGGLISTIALVCLFYIIVNNVNEKKHVNAILISAVFSVTMLALFMILKSFNVFQPFFERLASSHPSLTFLTGPVFTPIGSPNSLPFLFIFVLAVTLNFLADTEEKAMQQVLGITCACICLFAIGVTSAVTTVTLTSIAIWLLVIGCIVATLLTKIPISNNLLLQYLPVVLVTIFSLLFAFKPQIRGLLTTDLNFARYPEIPFNTSWSVVTGTFSTHKVGGFLVGTGPETYAFDFPRFRPVEQNNELNWHQNYSRGASYVDSLLVEGGILALAAHVFIVFIALSFFLRKCLRRELVENEIVFGLAISVLSILISSFLIFFSFSMLFYLWLFLGLVVVAYYIENKRAKEAITLSLVVSKNKIAIEKESNFLPSLFLAIIVIPLVVGGFFIIRNYIGEMQYKKSVNANYWKDYEAANDNIVKAIRKNDKRDYYHRQLAYIGLEALKKTLSEVSEDQELNQSYIAYLEKLIRSEVDTATSLNRTDPANWEATAVIFKQLIELSQGRAYGTDTLYAASQAISLNPYNPDNYIILGYIYQFNTDEELRARAEGIFVQAYNLKPSYSLSIFALGNYWEFVQEYDQAVNLYLNSLTRYYPSESDMNRLLNQRVENLREKQAGIIEEEEQVSPTDEEISDEVEEKITPSPAEEEPDVKGETAD